MRSIAVLFVALLFVPTGTAAEWSEAEEGLAVTVMRIESDTVQLTWSAAPGALTYAIYRGPTLDKLELLGQTANLAFSDLAAPIEDTWYVVVSRVHATPDFDLGPMRGKCLAVRGLTGISVTLAHCMPIHWP